MPDTNLSDLTWYGEAVAAISFIFSNRKEYAEISGEIGNDFYGYVPIWRECAAAAKIFMNEAAIYKPNMDYFWLPAIEDFADKFISAFAAERAVAEDDLHRWAAAAIEKNRK
jgi:hypothetical protein